MMTRILVPSDNAGSVHEADKTVRESQEIERERDFTSSQDVIEETQEEEHHFNSTKEGIEETQDQWDVSALFGLNDSNAAPEAEKDTEVDNEELVELSDEEPVKKKSRESKKSVSYYMKLVDESFHKEEKAMMKNAVKRRATPDCKGDLGGAKRRKKKDCPPKSLASLVLSESDDDMRLPLSQRKAKESDAPPPSSRTNITEEITPSCNHSITEFMPAYESAMVKNSATRTPGESSSRRSSTTPRGKQPTVKMETMATPNSRSQAARRSLMRTPPVLAAAKSSAHTVLKAAAIKTKEQKEEAEEERVKEKIKQELGMKRKVSSFPIANLVMDSYLRYRNDDHVRHIEKNIKTMARQALVLEGYEIAGGKIRITNGNHRLQAMLNVNQRSGKDLFSMVLVAVHPISLKNSSFSSLLLDCKLPHTAIEKVLHVSEFLDVYEVNRALPKATIHKIVLESLWQFEYSLRTISFARLLTMAMRDMLLTLREDELFNKRNMLNMYMAAYTRDRGTANDIIKKYSMATSTMGQDDRVVAVKKLREDLKNVEPSIFDALTDEGMRMKPAYDREDANKLADRLKGVKGAAESVRKMRRNYRARHPLATMEQYVRMDSVAKRHNLATFRESTCQSTASPIHFIDFDVLKTSIKRRLYFQKFRYDHIVIVLGVDEDCTAIFEDIKKNLVDLSFYGVEQKLDGISTMLMPIAVFVWQGGEFLDNEDAIAWCKDGGLKKEITIQGLQHIFPESATYFFSGTSNTLCNVARLVNTRGNVIEWDTDEDGDGELLLTLTGRRRAATQLNSQHTQLPGCDHGESGDVDREDNSGGDGEGDGDEGGDGEDEEEPEGDGTEE